MQINRVLCSSAFGYRVVALCGGVGGAKLAEGLASVLGARLTVIVNTGDDFSHLGLSVSPDIDSVIYRLACLNDDVRGWGRSDETWSFMEEISRLGADSWFNLGDRDLATHVYRTHMLNSGETLTNVTKKLAIALGIDAKILPMSDTPVPTVINTNSGTLSFQEYFVKHQCEPVVTSIDYCSATEASVPAEVIETLSDECLGAVIICPSNPYLSIAPILAIPALRNAVEQCGVPVIAVSPVIGGQALKGPAAKLMAQLDGVSGNTGIAAFYKNIIDGLVIDIADANEASFIDIPVLSTKTIMTELATSKLLAHQCLEFVEQLEGTGLCKE